MKALPDNQGAVAEIDFSDYPKCVLPAYHKFMTDTSRFVLLKGGAGSGKSVACVQKGIYRCFTEPGHTWLVTRKVGSSLRDSCFAEIVRVLGEYNLTQFCEIAESNLIIRIPATGAKILFKGLDDVMKIKSISRPTFVWIEEATETAARDVRQLNLRLRGDQPHYKQVMMSFNPVSAAHWIKKDFYDRAKGRTSLYSTTWRDNPFLRADDIAELEELADLDPLYAQVYRDGEWGEAKGLIFTHWTVEEMRYEPGDYDAVYAGLDFGYNHPSALVLVGFKDGVVYVFDEVYKAHLTNQELIAQVAPKVGAWPTVCDSAEPGRIEEFVNAGVRAQASEKGDGSVRAGIDWLKTHRIVVAPHCVNLIRELQMYHWAEDKFGNTLDKPVPVMDDAIAALRYAIEPLRHAAEPAKAFNPLRR